MADLGYGLNDPQKAQKYGYRSQLDGFKVGDLSYNSFVFPPTSKSSVTVIKEYDTSQRVVKYLTIAITIDCIITGETAGPCDTMMNTLRNRLSQPGQTLIFNSKGFGNFKINEVSKTSEGQKDVDYGPKPQVLEWEPIGANNACRISWLVVTRVPPCTGAPGNFDDIISYNTEVTANVSDNGLMTRVVKATIEFAHSRIPTSGTNAHYAVSGINDTIRKGEEFIFNDYPRIGGWYRNTSTDISENRKIVKWIITDTQLPSDTPPPQGCLRADIKEALSSSLDNAFRIWNMTLSGTIEVAKPNAASGINLHEAKKLAWFGLGALFNERLARQKGKRYAANADDTENGSYTKSVYSLPQNIRIDNEIYGNKIGFSITWMLVCPTHLLFAATGFLDAPEISGNTWDSWRNLLKTHGVADGFYPVGLVHENNNLIDLCNSRTSNKLFSSTPTARRSNDSVFSADCPPEENSWIDYQNDIELGMDNKTMVVQVLPDSAYPYQDRNPDYTKPSTKLDPVPVDDFPKSIDYLQPIIYNPTHGVFKVTMRGYAVRIGYKIDAPKLLSYGGAKATKIGKDVLVEKTVAVGASVQGKASTKKCTIYRLSWKKTYILNKAPVGTNKVTDGVPEKHL